MTDKAILEKLISIFKSRLNTDFEKLPEYETLKLFGNKINLLPYEMVYIFFDIEKEFSITISEDDIMNDKLTTIELIVDMIKEHLNSYYFIGNRHVNTL